MVSTERGFSVSYKNRFLYSKYAPERAILGAIDALTILPHTLILAASPVLWLGLSALRAKLPADCFILGIETDKTLHDFAKREFEKLEREEKNTAESQNALNSCAALLPFEHTDYLVNVLTGERLDALPDSSEVIQLPHISTFRRAILLEMSAGTQFDKAHYASLASLAENAIASFWKNRITLTKLGRLYSRNLFHNLAHIPSAHDFKTLAHRVTQPIFVFGAGESLEESIARIPKSQLEKCVIVAVDASLPVLQAHNIKVDAVVAVEGQLAIEKAYIGRTAQNSLIVADITSRAAVTRHSKDVTYIASKYTDAHFFKNLAQYAFFPPVVPPLGSVGLTAVYVALLLRANENVPVFVSGLDFSFSLGRTHTKNAPAHIARLCTSDKLHPVENYAAAFRTGARLVNAKNDVSVYTDTALEAYASSFKDMFKSTPNLYDAGAQGLLLGLQEISAEKITAYLGTIAEKESTDLHRLETETENESLCTSAIISFLEAEEKALNRIKELLMFGKDVARCSCSLEDELHELIAPREYLFLHFPDGYKCDTSDLSFLKRVRGQLDFFLKDIKRSLATLPSL